MSCAGGRNRTVLESQLAAGWLLIREVENRNAVEMLRIFLGGGAAEAIVLAGESGGSVLLADDLKARKTAQRTGLRTVGVGGFLLAAKKAGWLGEIGPSLRILQAQGFRLGAALVAALLEEAGEPSG